MSENVMSLNRPFSEEAFRKLDVTKLSIPELADRIRIGDRDSMMRMFRLLHDDLFLIVQRTIASTHQAEFIVRKSFAEVFYNHDNIDPDLFELHLIQVLEENITKQNIHNRFTIALNKAGHVNENKSVAKATIQEVSSPLMASVKAKAVPAKLALASADAVAIPDYSEVAQEAPVEKESESLTKTMSLPVILSSAAAIATAGVGGAIYHHQLEEKKDLSYTQMMASLQISFDTAEDGTEITTFEYQPGISQEVRDLVSSAGTLKTDIKALDLSRVGSTLVGYSLTKTDEYEQVANKNVYRSYQVVDTQLPYIAFNTESITITEGESIDVLGAVSSVVDPADGELTYVESQPDMIYNDSLGRIYEYGWYTVSNNVDTNTAGEYAITVHAVDNHGNVTDASIPVTVKAKPVVTVSNATITGTASVNTGANASSIYSLLTEGYGFTHAAASGLLANMQIESSFNPAAGSSYYGLCQWGGSRLSNLIAFCANNGYASDSVDGQIAFMVSEMGSGMINVMNSFSDSAEGAAEAGVYFRQNFERSAGLDNVANISASFYNAY